MGEILKATPILQLTTPTFDQEGQSIHLPKGYQMGRITEVSRRGELQLAILLLLTRKVGGGVSCKGKDRHYKIRCIQLKMVQHTRPDWPPLTEKLSKEDSKLCSHVEKAGQRIPVAINSGSRGAKVLVGSSTDGGLLGTPSLAKTLRRLLFWLTLPCHSRIFGQKAIDWMISH